MNKTKKKRQPLDFGWAGCTKQYYCDSVGLIILCTAAPVLLVRERASKSIPSIIAHTVYCIYMLLRQPGFSEKVKDLWERHAASSFVLLQQQQQDIPTLNIHVLLSNMTILKKLSVLKGKIPNNCYQEALEKCIHIYSLFVIICKIMLSITVSLISFLGCFEMVRGPINVKFTV